MNITLVILIIALIAFVWNLLALLVEKLKVAPWNWLLFWLCAVLWFASAYGIWNRLA